MNKQIRQQMQNRFSLRKLTIGLASVSLGVFFLQAGQVKADTLPATSAVVENKLATTDTQTAATQSNKNAVLTSTTNSESSNSTDSTAKSTTDQSNAVKPAAPSTEKPSYDGNKVVDTPFYNNPKGTSSTLINNKTNTGQYTIYFTAKDKSGKEYTSSYAIDNKGIANVYMNTLLDKDSGAYDPNSLELHFYYQNDTDQDQALNYTLRMPNWLNPYKAGDPESSLVPDSSRINDVKVTSKDGNSYNISSVTNTLNNVESKDGDLRRVNDIPVTLTIKGSDAINLVIPMVYNQTAKNQGTKVDDNNDFIVLENGTQTGKLNVRGSNFSPINVSDKIVPAINAGNDNYIGGMTDLPTSFDLGPTDFKDEDFLNNFYGGFAGRYDASEAVTDNTTYGDYTDSFLLLQKYEDYLTKHGYTVAFSNGQPRPYYVYNFSKTGAKLIDKNGNPLYPDDGQPYFEVVPVITLNNNQTYTTKTVPAAWDPASLVDKTVDPTNYSHWDLKSDSAVRTDSNKAQITAKDFTVTVTKDGQVVKPNADGKYDLTKPGVYTVTYSKDFNGTTISNSGTVTVNPVNTPTTPTDNNDSGSSETVVPATPDDNSDSSSVTPTTDNNSSTPTTDETTDTEKLSINPNSVTNTDKKAKSNKGQKTSRKLQHLVLKNTTKTAGKAQTAKSLALTESKTSAPVAAAVKNNQQGTANKLPQTGEKKGMLLSIIGLITVILGLFGLSINHKKENRD